MLDTLNGTYLGKGKFLPGLKKIGKYTSKVTGGIAKAFIPASIVNAAAMFDPTRKKGLANAKKSASELLSPAPAPGPVIKAKSNLALTPVTIGIGVAALGALFLLGKRR